MFNGDLCFGSVFSLFLFFEMLKDDHKAVAVNVGWCGVSFVIATR
jgi:hypothetical protein